MNVSRVTMSACVLLALACGGADDVQPSEISGGGEQPARTDANVYGSDALFTAFVRTERWNEVHAAIVSVLGEAPESRELQRLVALRSFAQVLSLETRRFGEIADDLPGLDPERAVVIRMFEVPAASASLRTAFEVSSGERVTPMRHVVAVPTLSAATTANALRARLERCTPTENAGSYRCTRGVLHTIEDPSDRVLWVVFSDDPVPPDPTTLWGRAAPTRALQWAAADTFPVSLHVRGTALRAVAAHAGSDQIARAIQHVEPEYADQMRAAGVGEMMGAYLRTAPYDREIDEAAVGLRTQPEPAIVWAAGLTEEGQRRFALQTDQTDPVTTPWADLRSSIPLATLSAPPPYGYEGLSPDRGRSAFRECGLYCVMQAMARPLASQHYLRGVRVLPDESPFVPRRDASLPAGALEFDLDLSNAPARDVRFFAQFVPTVHVRSALRGNSWLGTLSIRQPDANFVALPDGARPVLATASPEAQQCASTLAQQVSRALSAIFLIVEDERPQIRERAIEEANAVVCNAPEVADEVSVYREVLELIPAGPAPAPPPSSGP